MKKLYILIIAVALSFSAMAQVPWSWTSGFGSDGSLLTPRTGRGNIVVKKVNSIDPTAGFVTNWSDSIPGADVSTILELRSDGGYLDRDSPQDYDGKFKIVHDANNLYIFVQVADQEITVSDAIELFMAGYPDTLSKAAINAFVPVADQVTHGSYTWAQQLNMDQVGYWPRLGSFKAALHPTDATMNVWRMTVDSTSLAAGSSSGVSSSILGMDSTNFTYEGLPGAYSLIITVPFEALQFDYAADKKIQFEIKVTDADPDADGAGTSQFYWQNVENNVYAYVYYTGQLTMSDEYASPNAIRETSMETLNFMPNPAVNEVVFSSRQASVEVYNLVGQKVLSTFNTSTINVSELNSGVYMVKAKGQDNILRAGKLIVK